MKKVVNHKSRPKRSVGPTLAPVAAVHFVQRGELRRFRKVLVTGLGRSGTSAVASALQHWGFFLGPDSDSVFHESQAMNGLLKQRANAEMASVLENWLAVHERVAWKDPKIYSLGAGLVSSLAADWLVIVMFRDLVAIVARRVVADGVDFTEELAHCMRFQQALIAFTASTPRSVLFVSYERMMIEPQATLAAISSHLDLPASEADHDVWLTMLEDRERYRKLETRFV